MHSSAGGYIYRSLARWSPHTYSVASFYYYLPCRSVIDAIRKRGQQHSVSPEPQSETGDNQPRELPADLWASSLQSLYLHNNRLKWLPGYLGKLGALTRLDISRSAHCNDMAFRKTELP